MADNNESWGFADRLSQRVNALVSSALGAHTEGWQAILSQEGLTPTQAQDPPMPEAAVEAALTQLVAKARVELGELARAGRVPRDVNRALTMRLDRLVAVETERYREATSDNPSPKPPGGGLGAIFANVQATAAMSPWARAERWKKQVALTCRTCGAPQRESRNFKCDYCAGDLFRRTQDEG